MGLNWNKINENLSSTQDKVRSGRGVLVRGVLGKGEKDRELVG